MPTITIDAELFRALVSLAESRCEDIEERAERTRTGPVYNTAARLANCRQRRHARDTRGIVERGRALLLET